MSIRKLTPSPANAEHGAPAPQRVLAGHPVTVTHDLAQHLDGRVRAGYWRAEIGAWRVSYDEWEWCRIDEGRALIEGDDGTQMLVGPGDVFVIEPGFAGVWRVIEPMAKHWVVVLPG